jgi:hypothetical protein
MWVIDRRKPRAYECWLLAAIFINFKGRFLDITYYKEYLKKEIMSICTKTNGFLYAKKPVLDSGLSDNKSIIFFELKFLVKNNLAYILILIFV